MVGDPQAIEAGVPGQPRLVDQAQLVQPPGQVGRVPADPGWPGPARGLGPEQYDCLVALWKKESGWNVFAFNKGSGAYGIPQALPGSKMASAGADWQTNPATQITWGLGYVTGRYGSPCGAWAKSQSSGWY